MRIIAHTPLLDPTTRNIRKRIEEVALGNLAQTIQECPRLPKTTGEYARIVAASWGVSGPPGPRKPKIGNAGVSSGTLLDKWEIKLQIKLH